MLSELGYHRPTYDEILEDKVQLAKNIFGEDIDTSEQTPFGKFIRIGAYDLSKAYEDLEAIYYARFPNTATGVSLDRLCVFAGIGRNPATYAQYTLKVSGDPGTEVDEIIVCGQNPDIVFHNIEPFVIGEDGTATVTVECGTIGTSANGIAINEIVNPIAGINEVGESVQSKLAEDVESDFDLRNRFDQAMEGIGGSSLNAIRTAVLQVSTVKSVSMVENKGNVVDGEGRPPHSFETYVYGGEEREQDIAKAILQTKPAGISTHGTKSVTILDVTGKEQVINYTPSATISALIRISIKTNDEFPIDGIGQIQTNVADRVNGLDLGETLVLSTLYGCAYKVGGVPEVTSIEVSTDGGASYSINNVTVSEHNIIICGGVEVVS